jgi:hypothetical protein
MTIIATPPMLGVYVFRANAPKLTTSLRIPVRNPVSVATSSLAAR